MDELTELLPPGSGCYDTEYLACRFMERPR
ncbi:hypothetical protein ACVWXN_006658 [Bradyrhizobium sp. i1.4.4]